MNKQVLSQFVVFMSSVVLSTFLNHPISQVLVRTRCYAAALYPNYSFLDSQVWGPPINISRTPSRSKWPALVIDSTGTIHAVWSDDSLGSAQVFYTYKKAHDDWISPIQVTSNRYGISDFLIPDIAIDSHDTLHLVWRESRDGGDVYWYRTKIGNSWSDPEAVYTCSGCRLNPLVKIGVDSIGGIHILGAIYSHGIMGYYGKYFYKMPSGTWSELSPWTSGEVFEYDLALDNDNRVHVVWRAYVNYHYHILYTSYQLGIWQIPTQLSSNYSDTNLDPDVIITPWDNEVHAMWSEYPGKLHYAHRTPTGVWSTPILVAGDSGFFVPKMAIDSEHHALWVASRRNYADIYVIVKTQTDWLSPVVLFRGSPVGYYEETPPAIMVDGFGKAHIVWEDPLSQDIFYIGPGYKLMLPIILKAH
jgi:hypothetical protein